MKKLILFLFLASCQADENEDLQVWFENCYHGNLDLFYHGEYYQSFDYDYFENKESEIFFVNQYYFPDSLIMSASCHNQAINFVYRKGIHTIHFEFK